MVRTGQVPGPYPYRVTRASSSVPWLHLFLAATLKARLPAPPPTLGPSALCSEILFLPQVQPPKPLPGELTWL